MIQDTSAMDQPITTRRPLAKRLLLPGTLLFALLVVVALVAPSLSRWMRAERSIDLSKVRLATVVRGDLERDVFEPGAGSTPKGQGSARGERLRHG